MSFRGIHRIAYAVALAGLIGSQPAVAETARAQEAAQKDSVLEARRERLTKRLAIEDLRELDGRAADLFAAEKERLKELRLQAGPAWTALGPTFSPTYTSPVGAALPGQDDTGLIAAIATHPTEAKTIIVGVSAGGLWKTVDGGATWRAVAENLPTGGLQIGAVAYAPSNPSRVYAGSACGDNSTTKSSRPGDGNNKLGIGLLVSNDGGDSFAKVDGTPPGDFFWQIVVDRENADVLLAGTDRGLQRSTDGGKTWTGVISTATIQSAYGLDSAPATVRVTSIARAPSNPSIVYASAYESGEVPGTVFKSTDGGQTFTTTTQSGIPPENFKLRGRIQLAVGNTDPNLVFALVGTQADKQGGFARSTDGGSTWTTVAISNSTTNILGSQAGFCNVLVVDPNTGHLFAGGLDLWTSEDNGDSWTKISEWAGPTVPARPLPYLHADQHTVVWGADRTMYVGNDGGIFARTATAFKGLNSQIVGFMVDEICANPAGTIILVGNQDNGTAIMRTDGRWDQIGGGDGYGCRVSPASDLIFTTSATNQSIEMSTDGGATFKESSGISEAGGNKSSFRTFILQHPTEAARVFTYTKHKIWRSNDDGKTWAQASESMPIISDISDITADADGTLALVDDEGQVLRSTDDGTSWTKTAKFPGRAASLRVRIRGARTWVSSAASVKAIERVYVHDGSEWTAISKTGQADGLPDLPVWSLALDPVNPQVLWAGSYMGLYRSGDAGASWARHGEGLPNVPVTAITFPRDGSAVIVGTSGRGIFRAASAPGTLAPAPRGPLVTPVADFGYEPAAPRPARRVVFADKSTYGSKWSWDFGDGTTSKEINPEHVFATAGTFNVKLTVTSSGGETHQITKPVTVAYPNTGTGDVLTYIVPVIVRSAGAGGTSFGSELTITNRSTATLNLSFRTKDGLATYAFRPGQEVYGDIFAFLGNNGLPTPDGNVVTTLRIEVRGARDISQFGALVRVTTPPNSDLRAQGIIGRFGLALSATPLLGGASKEAVLYGLQQVGAAGVSGARSNLACAHAGGGSLGNLGLEVTYHNGETAQESATKDTFNLSAFGFEQKNTPLASRGIENGWATIKRVSGNDQFVCYATVLDNVSGDSSFVEMINVDTEKKKNEALLPVIVDTGGYKTELTIANRSLQTLGGEFVLITSSGALEYGEYEIEPLSQVIIPDIVAALREAGFTSVPPGAVASLHFEFGTVQSGGGKAEGRDQDISVSDVFVGGRTYSTKAGGQFGLAYPFAVLGEAADLEAYVYGLQQSGTRGQEGGTRSNLALVHALDGNNEDLGLEITYYDSHGTELGRESVTLKPGQWTQIGTPLARFTNITNGYARVRRTSGTDQFYAYAVLNDQGNDDGSFVKMTIP
ncbi:MAG: PKD domain-containing protein [Acidobacteria bacterium]|nr:PKD domain-containing protein [Acidobacteriota bacterium]